MDLFERYDLLPAEVVAILEKQNTIAEILASDPYKDCAKLKEELEAVGYTMDYGLDAVPYDLRKL